MRERFGAQEFNRFNRDGYNKWSCDYTPAGLRGRIDEFKDTNIGQRIDQRLAYKGTELETVSGLAEFMTEAQIAGLASRMGDILLAIDIGGIENAEEETDEFIQYVLQVCNEVYNTKNEIVNNFNNKPH